MSKLHYIWTMNKVHNPEIYLLMSLFEVNTWNKYLVHHFGGVFAWKSGLRFLIRALEVPFSGTSKCQKCPFWGGGLIPIQNCPVKSEAQIQNFFFFGPGYSPGQECAKKRFHPSQVKPAQQVASRDEMWRMWKSVQYFNHLGRPPPYPRLQISARMQIICTLWSLWFDNVSRSQPKVIMALPKWQFFPIW